MQKKRLLHPNIFVSYLIKYFYILMMSLIVIICVFFSNIDYTCKNNWYLAGEGGGTILYLIFGILILFLLQIVSGKLFSKLSDKQIIIANIIFFVIQITIIYNSYFLCGWDVSAIRKYAIGVANGDVDVNGASYYFGICQNNLFLLCTYANIYKLFNLFNINNYVAHFFIIILQCITYSITSFLLYKILGKITNNKVFSVTGWFLYHIYIGLSPWMSVPYFDAGGLLFPILNFYIYYFIKPDTKPKLALKYLLLGFSVLIGYEVKPQTSIIMIAIVILYIFRKRKITLNLILNTFKKVLLVFIGASLAFLLFRVQVNNLPFEENKNMNFGITHFFMMGLNWENNGVYNYNDVYISESVTSTSERAKLNLEIAKQRIEDYGLNGLSMLWYKKLLTNYNDGTFSWHMEGTFVEEDMSVGKPLSFLAKFYNLTNYEGILFYIFESKSQLLWYGVLSLSIFSFFKKKKDREELSAMKLGIIGLTLFEMLFEARNRYLFTYAPFYIMLAIYGMYCIENSFFNKKREEPKICEESSVN